MRASRLVSMMMLLQARGRMTADELADELEVSVRTIYRDALSLQEAGVPLVAESGHDGGYELSGGYRTNLTGLTGDEAAALFLAGMPGPAMDLGMGGSVTTLRRKLVAALPAEQRQSATRMSRCFLFDAPGWYQDTERPAHLPAVTDAVLNGHRIRIRYSSWERQSTKTLEPYGLVLKGGRWYLVAGSTRKNRTPSTYRIDQIVDITSLDQPFEPPSGFDLAAYWNDSVRSFKERLRSGTAVIKLSANGAEHYRQATGEHPAVIDRSSDGWATAIAPIESIGHARGVFLQLGAEVEVLEPAELRAAMAAAVHELAALYQLTA